MGGCSKGKAHNYEMPLHLCWSLPWGPTEWFLSLISVKGMWVMCQAWHEDKQVVFHEDFVGQQTDLEHYSKFYRLPMKGKQQWNTARNGGDFVTTRASRLWTHWSLVRSVPAIPDKRALQYLRWLDARAFAIKFSYQGSGKYATDPRYGKHMSCRLQIYVSGRWIFCQIKLQNFKQIWYHLYSDIA